MDKGNKGMVRQASVALRKFGHFKAMVSSHGSLQGETRTKEKQQNLVLSVCLLVWWVRMVDEECRGGGYSYTDLQGATHLVQRCLE